MCAKPEPHEYFQPVADLHDEVQAVGGTHLSTYNWPAISAFFGLLENV